VTWIIGLGLALAAIAAVMVGLAAYGAARWADATKRFLLRLEGARRPAITSLAARYTTDRRANFDIYLPEWLAERNKAIFGTIYLVGVVAACARWVLAVN